MQAKTVVPFQDLPLADKGGGWDAAAAKKRVQAWAGGDDWESAKYRKAFLWYDSAAADKLDSYKLPLADVKSGTLKAIPEGIYACAASLQGGRTALKIPDSDVEKCKSHLGRYYKKMGETAPWDKASSPVESLARPDGLRYKSMAFEVKELDEEEGVFEGWAAAFGNSDSYGDVIERGAFKKTLKENAKRIKVLWQHSFMNPPIGLPLEMSEEEKGGGPEGGLFVRAKLLVHDIQLAREVFAGIREGVINELSIGYRVVKAVFDKELEIYRLKEIALYEFSPVNWAANELAVITGSKAALLAEAISALRPEDIDRNAATAAIGALRALVIRAEPAAATPGASPAARFSLEPVGDHSSLAEAFAGLATSTSKLSEVIDNG